MPLGPPPLHAANAATAAGQLILRTWEQLDQILRRLETLETDCAALVSDVDDIPPLQDAVRKLAALAYRTPIPATQVRPTIPPA